jgi:diaminohydroxyphosphoribosylaminopyrimidine deaminase/5-amino-6-(5-phosphoribosylamino)uracil reductase
MTTDEKYMARCLQLAENGRCTTSPNPMVGAVVVCDGRIIGEGYHVHCGQGHAEVNALRSVKERHLLPQSTIYVSLEPCSHYGKTPPCADLIIREGLKRVVVGCIDPFPQVAGRGIRKLQEAGIEVTVGVLEEACRRQIRRFITANTLGRPYVTLKWAQSADGFIDVNRRDGRPVVLSSPLTRILVHKRRAEHDAIMVGTRTALLDDPSLTTRYWPGRNPLRVVIDRHGVLPPDLQLFNGEAETVVYTTGDLREILSDLTRERKVQSLMVEGGACLLQSFFDEGLWDEAYIEVSPTLLGDGVKAPTIPAQYPRKTEKSMGRTIFHVEKT